MLIGTMKHIKYLMIVAIALFSAVQAQAQQIDEVRFGGNWAQPNWIEASHPEGDQFGIGGEILFAPVNIDYFGLAGGNSSKLVEIMMNPRPHLGGMVNFDDDGTSYAFTGLTWHYAVDEVFFLETSFGFSVNNGKEDNGGDPNRASLGSNFLFHESFGFGVNLSEDMTAVFAVEHLSHAGLFGDDNRGLTHTSLRLGQKF